MCGEYNYMINRGLSRNLNLRLANSAGTDYFITQGRIGISQS
jgi:hypothetical protein